MEDRSSTNHRSRSGRAGIFGSLVWLLLVPADANAWPDPACNLQDYEEVTGGPSLRGVPGYLRPTALAGVEQGIFVTRISGDPGSPVGAAAPGKVWPEVMTHRYSLVHPCNADDSMCLLDVDLDCVDVGSPALPNLNCSDTPLGPLIIDSNTLQPIVELSDPVGEEDRRWDPSEASRLIYVNESGDVGYLDVATDTKTSVHDFGEEYTGLELGSGNSKSNPSLAGDELALFGRRSADAQPVCFAFNLMTGVRGPDVVTEEDVWCGMSPKGEILTVYFRGASSRPGQLDAYDLQGNLLTTFPENQHPSHWAFTVIDPLGAAIESAVGRQKITGPDPQILRSLSTGSITQLDVGFGWSHTSTTNEPGYDGWSITSQEGSEGRIGLVSHRAQPGGDGITKFVAYTRSDERDAEGDIRRHSEPTCADFGKRRILCASNWHSRVAAGEGVGAFVWDLSGPGGPCGNLPYEVWPKPRPQCDDGLDNDGDGLLDLADPVCGDPTWISERKQCQDGVDNDRDGLIDFDGGVSIHGPGAAEITAPDPNCHEAWQPLERGSSSSRCGLGFGLAFGLLPLLVLHQRRSERTP